MDIGVGNNFWPGGVRTFHECDVLARGLLRRSSNAPVIAPMLPRSTTNNLAASIMANPPSIFHTATTKISSPYLHASTRRHVTTPDASGDTAVDSPGKPILRLLAGTDGIFLLRCSLLNSSQHGNETRLFRCNPITTLPHPCIPDARVLASPTAAKCLRRLQCCQ